MKCLGCGKCCKDLDLTHPDYERIKKKLPNIDDYITRQQLSVYRIEGVCPFLKENKCIIYEIRPNICRAYPVRPAIIRDGYDRIIPTERPKFTIDSECPQAHTVTKHDIKRGKVLIQTSWEVHSAWLEARMSKEEITQCCEDALKVLDKQEKGKRKRVKLEDLV